jgi:endonuclease YncB( thermonuclease family)
MAGPVSQPSPKKSQDRPDDIAGALLPPSLDLDPPYLIIDGLTFAAGRITIRLNGVQGPPANATCKDESGLLWACGLQARAALNNEISKRNLSCAPIAPVATPVIEATCRVADSDLARRLVSAGWARPLDRGHKHEVEQEAQRIKRGLWNGNWSLVERATDPSMEFRLRESFLPP